jgi:hypothetical protein
MDDTKLVADEITDHPTDTVRNPSMFSIGINVAFQVPAATMKNTTTMLETGLFTESE